MLIFFIELFAATSVCSSECFREYVRVTKIQFVVRCNNMFYLLIYRDVTVLSFGCGLTSPRMKLLIALPCYCF